ncbi:MAG TPA: hypothetical protein PKZ75_09190 [Bacteroidia bacterium]|nr:hypothetical protein [Bacteroidia bacterium]
MKYKALLKIALLFTSISSYSQTVTVAINDKVLVAKDTAIIDVNADGNIDIKISRYVGIDNVIYSASSKQANVKLGDLPKLSGQPFSNYGNQCSLPSSVFGCFWIPAWQLNTGQRYMGYYRLNAPGDTTFGYLNLNFLGDNQSGCFDTLYVYSNTYSSVSNIHLLAGQSSSTVCSTPITYSIQVTQPTCSSCCDGSAQIVNLSGGCSTLELSSGRIIDNMELTQSFGTKQFNTQHLANGLYLLSLKQSNKPSVNFKIVSIR